MKSSLRVMAEAAGSISASIHSKLEKALQPVALKLINDSHKHSGHYKSDGSAASSQGETHFRLMVVSEKFESLSLLKRHQMIYKLLDEEIKAGVHALSMTTKTPAEASSSDQQQ